MNDTNLRLDGNAAGGLLNEIFPFEMTTAVATCAGCAKQQQFGEVICYRHGMGVILRCAVCDTALIRIAHLRGWYRLDLSGMTYLGLAADISNSHRFGD